jgi:hypothetical protein
MELRLDHGNRTHTFRAIPQGVKVEDDISLDLQKESLAKESGDATYKLIIKAGDQQEEHDGLALNRHAEG